MTSLSFYAKDRHGRALFLVRFVIKSDDVRASTTYLIGDNDHSALPEGSQLVAGWVSLVLYNAQHRVYPDLVHHYEVVGD